MAEGHLEEGLLAEFAAGAMSTDEAKAIARHLAECAHCSARHEQLAADLFSKTLAAPISRNSPPPVDTRPDAPGAHEDSSTENLPVLRKGATLGGRYVLIERLGAGGMGEVFSAYDPKLDRKLALKLLRPGSLSAEEGRVRLEREAQAMARLSHPNVVTVFDVGHWEDRLFVAMEFVEGETLSNWLRGDHDWKEIVRAFLEAGAGLAAAHSAGIVHRDFKPDNVLIGKDGRPRVMDFGLARQASSSNPGPIGPTPSGDAPMDGSLNSPITRDGAVMGTPGYMAPEQLSGLATDARSDQFSFCVALYEALYGRRPFGGNTLRTHRDEILAGKISPLPSGTPVPGWLYDAVKRGLDADPAARWPSMNELLAALRPKREQNRRRLVAALIAISVLAVGAVAIAVRGQQRLSQCGGFDVRLQHVWDEPTRARLKANFAAARVPFANDSWKTIEATLDKWTRQWVAVSTESCELEKVKQVDSVEVHQLKVLCLDSRLEQLKAIENLLSSSDSDVITNSVAMVRGLEEVDDCRDVAALLRNQHPRDEVGHEKEKALQLALFQARALHDLGKYAQGLDVITKALTAAEGAPPGPIAEARLLQGRLQWRMSEVKSAYATLELALLDAERAGEASLVARTYSRESMVLGSLMHKFDDAHRAEALAMAAASRVRQDKEVEAELSSNSGQVALEEGKWEQARDAFQNALTLQEQALGPDNPEVGRTLNNLGMALSQMGKFREATEVYERSRDLHVRNVGEMHPDTANSLTNLAVIYRREGRLSEAYTALDNALKARRLTLGEDHPDLASSYMARGKILVKMDHPEQALDDFNHALAIRLKKFGPDDPQVAAVYDDLAQFYIQRGSGKEALEEAQRAYDIDFKALGPEHVSTSYALDKVGKAYGLLGNWKKAEDALTQSLEARKTKRGLQSEEVAASYRQLGDLYVQQNKPGRALTYYEQSIDIHTHNNTSNEQALAAGLAGAGHCQMMLGEPQKALKPLEQAIALREKGEDLGELAKVRFLYARALYDGEPDQKARALELASATRDSLPTEDKDELQGWLKTHPAP